MLLNFNILDSLPNALVNVFPRCSFFAIDSQLRSQGGTFGDLTKEEAPQISLYGAFSCLKLWSKGQSRTDTGSLLLVFEDNAIGLI